jgi:hypothetical protein
LLQPADKPIAAPRDGLNVPRLVCIVSQSRADLVDGEVDAAFEVDEGVVAPDVLVNFFAGDNLPRAFYQEQENGKLLRPEPDQVSALAQLTIRGIECEWAEAN